MQRQLSLTQDDQDYEHTISSSSFLVCCGLGRTTKSKLFIKGNGRVSNLSLLQQLFPRLFYIIQYLPFNMWRPRSGFFFFFPGSEKQQQQLYELTYFDSTAIDLRTRRRSQEILITNARSVSHFFCKEPGINLSVIVPLSSFYCKGWDPNDQWFVWSFDNVTLIIVTATYCTKLISQYRSLLAARNVCNWFHVLS